ncbi:MAG: ABC transporter ATP-binding protein [Calditrichaeota bacterium]|nr:ABC transporter ATP-binding protein [Calditrichota bacterium]
MFALTRQFMSYLGPVRLWIVLGLVLMLLASLLAGVNIGMIYPFFEGVFLRPVAPLTGETVAISRALSTLLSDLGHTLGSGSIETIREGAGLALDRFLGSQSPWQVLVFLCGAALALSTLKLIITYGYRICFVQVEQVLIRELRNHLFRQIQDLGMGVFLRFRRGEIISRLINDVMVVRTLTITKVSDLLMNLLQSLVYLGLALVIDWRLTALSLFVLAPAVAALNLLGQKLRTYSRRAQEHLSEVTTRLSENLSGFRVVQAFFAHGRETQRFERATLGYFRRVRKLEFVAALSAPFGEWASTLVAVSMLWVGGRRVLAVDGGLSAAAFLTFLAALLSLLYPLKVAARAWNELQRGTGAGERLMEVLHAEPQVREAPDAIPAPPLVEKLRLENVRVRYEGQEALRGIDLSLHRGEFLALVGASGSGKTTIANLLLRLQDPDEGAVLLDGQDVRRFTLGSYRSHFGVVSQETFLFRLTVAENVAYPEEHTDAARVEAALRTANAWDFVQAMGGPESLIEEAGANLSGGQRQRLAIARAIHRQPEVLLLDEATSALDTESEILVQEALDRSVGERTALVIAHRLSTIIRADRIVCLKEGRIEGSGPHAELLESCAEYRKLYDLQFKV